jgi:hypothetical protein
MEVDVDVNCYICGGYIRHMDDLVCRDCYEGETDEGNKITIEKANQILTALTPYFNEAVFTKSVIVPGDVAVKIRDAIRSLE